MPSLKQGATQRLLPIYIFSTQCRLHK